MVSLPLPIVVVLFLGFFLVNMFLADKPWTKTRIAFAILMALFIVHGVVTTLVWSQGLLVFRPALPILASLLPFATWMAFRSMAQDIRRLKLWRLALHGLPTAVLIPLAFTGSLLIDPIIITSFIVHGVLLIRLGMSGPDGFQTTLLHRALSASRATTGAGVLLLINAAVDVSIIVDFQLYGGRHVPTILSAISVLVLLMLALLAVKGTNAASEDDSPDASEPTETSLPGAEDNQHQIVARVDQLMKETRLYTDPDLTLVRIARKVGLPARDISSAINRHNSMNVSQYVNRLRLDEACQRLATTDESITNIHLDSGFQTKSNFNREFKRQFGCSPSQWRATHRANTENPGTA